MYQYWVYYRCTYTYLLHKKHITSLASCLAMRAFEATAARKEAAFHADEEHGRGSPENRCAGNIRKSPSEFETSGSYYWVIPLCTIPWLVYTFIIYIYVIYYICMLYNIVCIYINIPILYYNHDSATAQLFTHATFADGRLWHPGRCQRTVMRNQRKSLMKRPNCCGNEMQWIVSVVSLRWSEVCQV